MCFHNGVIELNNWCSEREYQRICATVIGFCYEVMCFDNGVIELNNFV